MPNMPAYSSARRSSSAVAVGWPSSVIATQPAALSSAMSASSSPFCPFDTAPIGYTRARFAAAALARISDVTVALSFTGLVFGMHATAVNPPATAEATPVATVSLCSCPGSRRCTCISMRPGTTPRPAGTSITVAPSTGRSRPTLAITPSVIRMSNAPSSPLTGSTTRPPLSSFFMFGSAGEQVQHRHPDRHAVGHLVEDHRVGAVGHFGGNLDAPVHRTRVHDHHVRLRESQPRLGHAEHLEVLAQRGEIGALHAFELNPQQHHHVGVGHSFVHVARDVDAEPPDFRRNERRRTTDPDLGAHLREQVNVRAQHAAVQQVADDGHLQPLQAPLA